MASAVTFLTEVDRPHLFVVHDFGGRALREDRTLHQHGDLFGKAEHYVHIVLDDEHGDVGIERRNHIENEMAFGRRYTGGRLIKEEYPRFLRERNRDFHEPLTAIGQLAHELERIVGQSQGIRDNRWPRR